MWQGWGELYTNSAPSSELAKSSVHPKQWSQVGCPAILGSEAQTTAWFPGAPARGCPPNLSSYDAGPKLPMPCARPATHHQKRKARSRGEHRSQQPAVSDSVTLMEWFLAKSIKILAPPAPFFFSKLLWLFGIVCISIQIAKFFVLVL